jgi:hypothetical protein
MGFWQVEQTLSFTPSGTKRRTVRFAMDYAMGTSEGESFGRAVADVRVAMENPNGGLAVRARGGQVNSDAAVAEQFFVGGTASPYLDGGLVTNRVEHMGLPFGITGGPRFGILTLETTGALRFYHDWIVGGDEEFGETLRVLGAEYAVVNIPRITVMRVPEAQLRAGVTHVLNGAARNNTYGYVGLSVTP